MIKLIKGDDARRLVSVNLPSAAFADGAKIEFEIGGLKTTVPSTETIEIYFPASWTELQPIGRIFGTWRLIDTNGMKATITNTFPVLITNEVGNESAESESDATVRPIVDFSDIEELDTSATQGEIKAALNKILKRLKTGVLCFGTCLALTIYGNELKPDTILDDIPGTTPISNLIGAAGIDEIAASADDAKNTVNALTSIILGDDCQLVSTNYDSKVHIPHLYLRFKIKDEATGSNTWQIVWNEKTRWDWFLNDHLPMNYYTKAEVKAELDQKADRAWGFYDSHTGAYAPEGFTWISSPQIALAANMAYQRVVTTGGAIFVLTSTRMTTTLGGDPTSTNGFFRISDDKGNAIFEITKGSERIQPAMAGSITTEIIDGNTIVRVPYNVECAEHPKLYCTRSIDSHLVDWKAEDESGCPALVTWTGSSGAWMAEVRPYTPSTAFFVQATYKEGGKDTIKHYAPIELTTICIKGTNYPVNVKVINGKKVMVLE